MRKMDRIALGVALQDHEGRRDESEFTLPPHTSFGAVTGTYRGVAITRMVHAPTGQDAYQIRGPGGNNEYYPSWDAVSRVIDRRAEQLDQATTDGVALTT